MLTYAIAAMVLGAVVSVTGIALVLSSLVSASNRGQQIW